MGFKSNAAVARVGMVLCVAACGGSAGPAVPAGSAGTAALTGGAGAPAGLAGAGAGAGAAAGGAGSLAANGGSGGVLGSAGAGGSAAANGGAGAAGPAGAGGAGGAVAAAGMGGAGAGKGGSSAAGSGGSAAGAFALTSPVVKEGEMIPADYRCAKPSPALSWTPGPAGTMSYAIVLKDTTSGFSMGTMHWTIYDIPASVTSLPMGVPTGATLTDPAGAKQGQNYQNANAFTGPCGGMNTYRFTLYALSVASLPGLSASSKGAQVETAAEGSSKLATAVLNIRSMP